MYASALNYFSGLRYTLDSGESDSPAGARHAQEGQSHSQKEADSAASICCALPCISEADYNDDVNVCGQLQPPGSGRAVAPEQGPPEAAVQDVFLAAAVAGVALSGILAPVELVKCRLQACLNVLPDFLCEFCADLAECGVEHVWVA